MTRRQGLFPLPLPLVLFLSSGAFSVSNADVLVWIQTSSQGQHPTIYLQPSDTMVLEPPKDGATWADTLSVKRTLTHQTGWVFKHCNCSILYKCLDTVYKPTCLQADMNFRREPTLSFWLPNKRDPEHWPDLHRAANIPALASYSWVLYLLTLALKIEVIGMWGNN